MQSRVLVAAETEETLTRTSAALVWKGAKSEKLSFVTTIRDY